MKKKIIIKLSYELNIDPMIDLCWVYYRLLSQPATQMSTGHWIKKKNIIASLSFTETKDSWIKGSCICNVHVMLATIYKKLIIGKQLVDNKGRRSPRPMEIFTQNW